MSEHYYSAKPTVEHELRAIETVLTRSVMLKFMTDAGVFSKSGSILEVRCLLSA